jgi:hypothetical protein
MAFLSLVPGALVALTAAGAAAVAAGVAVRKGLLEPAVDLIGGVVKIIGDVTDKTGEQKRHHFFSLSKTVWSHSHLSPLTPSKIMNFR